MLSLPAALAPKPPKDQANYLAWRHCWLHWRVGMQVLGASIIVFFILAPYLPFGAPTNVGQAAGIALLTGLYLGGAAAVFGMLRVPLMQRLFERALVEPLLYRKRLLLGTALIFWLPIVPLYLLLLLLGLRSDPANMSAGLKLLWLLVPGLPWLAGALRATWKLWALK